MKLGRPSHLVLLYDDPTGILGLTVLAVSNSVGDWVAGTAVARAGKPGMAIASCFGSPLLNDVLGFSIALIVRSVVCLVVVLVKQPYLVVVIVILLLCGHACMHGAE